MIRGVISHPEIKLLTDEDLHDLLQGKQLHGVKKTAEDTAGLALKRKDLSEGLPQFIVLGWDTVKVRQCIRRPVRCYHCQKYGHVASECRKKTPICGRCAAEGHLKAECTVKTPTRAACQDHHETLGPTCEAWKHECTITKLKHEQRISYAAALSNLHPQPQEEAQEEEDIDEDQGTEDRQKLHPQPREEAQEEEEDNEEKEEEQDTEDS